MALSTIHSVLLPYNAMARDTVPARALLQCLNLSGAPGSRDLEAVRRPFEIDVRKNCRYLQN
jgi:hypothetical protein